MNVAPCHDAPFQIVVDLGKLLAHLITELFSEQAAARGEVCEHAEECAGLDLAFVAPVGDDV